MKGWHGNLAEGHFTKKSTDFGVFIHQITEDDGQTRVGWRVRDKDGREIARFGVDELEKAVARANYEYVAQLSQALVDLGYLVIGATP